jgi:phosphate transport system permease protein
VHGTSEKEIAVVQDASGANAVPLALAIAPKENGLYAATVEGLRRWSLDPGYAGVTLGTLFRPVWYESYAAPIHMWQSSAGEDSAEPKLGLWPLVFGTLKATFYSMLIGVPLALLAAIFTSEFLSARAKARVKPTIELMASLPSVVLGFLAALVFAPFVEQHLAGILASLFALPLFLLLGAFAWQMLPRDLAAKKAGYRLPVMALVALPLALGSGLVVMGPLLDELLFGGGLRYWLDGARQVPIQGSAFGGWLFFCLPIAALLVAWSGGWLARRSEPPLSHRAQATRSLLMFLGGLGVAALLACGAAALLSSFADLRGAGSVLDTYDQRNALVVGFVMGFAIVPIVYTIAEDALSSVPGHLRGASLGAGATTWQTAVRVVIPTAMSGLFSACMIGLGRAVGETMIVLMAAGSTPVLDINMFNGFRTLSANIATELPEAVQGSAHYRTLFLAALVLFAMTFVLNSVAESVRQRFRERAFEL